MRKLLLLIFLCFFVTGTSAWAGENAGAVVAFDLELKDAAEAGYQGHWKITGVGADQTVVLSIYGKDVSNLKAFGVKVEFEPDKVAFVSAGFSDPDWSEAYILDGTGAFEIKKFDPANPQSVYILSAAFEPGSEAEAPDGEGLIGWLQFTTSSDFTSETTAAFTLTEGSLTGFDGVTDDVTQQSIDQGVGKAYLNPVAVEPSLWGQIKALFK